MFIEKRIDKKRTKYYLIHSYREDNKVKKIRKYLGADLSPAELKTAKETAERKILEVLEEMNTEIFNFSLSKNQIIKLNELDKKIRIHHLTGGEWVRFTEDFVFNTNAIEGSTVQLDEVKDILEKQKIPDNAEEIETEGVARAVDFIRNTKEDLSLRLIRQLHKFCFDGSKPFAGQFRNVNVVIKNGRGEIIHQGVHLSQLSMALKDFIEWYAENKHKFKPLVLASIVHNQFEHIHPFQDGNGRVGRLLLNFILIKNKYPPINIRIENRAEYYSALHEYSKKHNLKPTITFLINQYNKRLKKVTTPKKK